jgi:hypothetical protein
MKTIWVRSCGRIHEFEADRWVAGNGTLEIIGEGDSYVASFTTWDWVRLKGDGDLLDDANMQNTCSIAA